MTAASKATGHPGLTAGVACFCAPPQPPSMLPTPAFMHPPARRRAVAIAAIVAVTVAAFANSLAGDFVFDDVCEIADNQALGRLWPPWEPLTAGNRNPARFLPTLSFAVERRLWGVDPRGYHVTNLAIHVAAALALFDVAQVTLRSPRLAGRFGRHAVPLAAAIAAVWAVHPLQTQAVTYVYQRIESLCGMCCLVSLAAFARAAAGGWPVRWTAACVAACAAAMACKENAVVLPLVILAYDWFFVACVPAEIAARRRLYAALAATWAILAVQLLAQAGHYQEFHDVRHPPLAYLLTQPGVILHYLRLAVWPAGLCLDYEWPLVRSAGGVILPGAVLVAALAATAAGTRRRRPWAWLGVAFFLTLAPTSSLVPVAAVAAEHRMYLPLAAMVAAVVLAVFAAAGPPISATAGAARPRAWALGLAAAVVACGLAAATRQRNDVYRSREAIWEDVRVKRPRNFRGHSFLAERAFHAGDTAAAERHAERAARLEPRAVVFRHIALLLSRRGEPVAAEQWLRRAAALHAELLPADAPTRVAGRIVLANHLHEQGRDAEAADLCAPLLADVDAALGAASPLAVMARTNVAHGAFARGDMAAAERCAAANLSAAMRAPGPADPATQSAAAPLVATLVETGRPAEAEAWLRRLMAAGRGAGWPRRPDLAVACRLLAGLLERSDRPERLIEAATLREEVLEAVGRRPEPDPLELARAEAALGNARALVLEAGGRFSDMESVAGRTLAAAVECLGPLDPLAQRAAVLLAASCYRAGRGDEAERILRDHLAAAARDSRLTDEAAAPPAAVEAALAGLLEQSGRLDEAITLRRSILRDALERLGPDNPATQRAAVALKAVLAARDRGAAPPGLRAPAAGAGSGS